MPLLVQLGDLPEGYTEENVRGDLLALDGLPQWTDMVIVEPTAWDNRHVLVSWLPPNALTNMRIISSLRWQGGHGDRANVQVVFFYCGDVQFPGRVPSLMAVVIGLRRGSVGVDT